MKRRSLRLSVLGQRDHEFASGASYPPKGESRRDFLKYAVITAALAGTGLGGCTRQPREKIVPRVQMPEELVPGEPLYFATTHTHDGYARGAIATTYDGRPTKLDGNPDHPASLGAGDVWMQSAVWSLYDPERLRTPMRGETISDWSNFANALLSIPEDGLRLLTGRVTSPTLGRLVAALRQARPDIEWHRWTPTNDDAERAGTTTAFGQPLKPVYDLSNAKVIVSLDADFLLHDLALARAWSHGRSGNRLWVAETTPTVTGASADEVLRMHPSLISRLVVNRRDDPWEGVAAATRHWMERLSRDLAAAGRDLAVLVGPGQPAEVHAAVARLHHDAGCVGHTVRYIESPEPELVGCGESLRALVTDMNAGRVKTLVVADCDVLTNAPSELDVAAALAKVPKRISLSTYADATAQACEWKLPLSHELESWGDGRAPDGTAALTQPMILPLHRSRTLIGLLSLLIDPVTPAEDMAAVKATWAMEDAAWTAALQRGVIPDSAAASVVAEPQVSSERPGAATPEGMTLTVRPDPTLFDGSHARNAWLRELPHPMTKLSWASPVLLSPADAKRLGVTNGGTGNAVECSIVTLTVDGRTADLPAFIADDQPDGVATVYLGDAAAKLRTLDAPWNMPVSIKTTGETTRLACTQQPFMQQEHGRVIVKVDGHSSDEGETPLSTPDTLYPLWNYEDRIPDQNKWGMSIDTSGCIGCNACVVACQAENNIPTVGEAQVKVGREMQWIRVDRYRDSETGRDVFQPTMCMHCENAPCEEVCPVNATVHDMEGLNVQVYNRCVGTRYCSNNCPYKVRHFNFLHYTDKIAASPERQLAMNPNVTVRSRGVMEKCTYCLQRISAARITAKKENRPVRDGEVTTACQQTCPTQAIVFGNLNDPAAAVTKRHARPDSYGLLPDLMTRPRTQYLPKQINPAEGGDA